MTDTRELAQRALRAAVEVRQKLRIERSKPLCPLDVAEALGLRVQVEEIGSFEGIYAKETATVLLSSARPPGRRNFTCGHEIGHWYFKHGDRIDALNFDHDDIDKPEERLVNLFSSFLLMPQRAIERAFGARRILPTTCDPIGIYAVANQLGVGYETLTNHLCWTTRAISPTRLKHLNSTTPKLIKANILAEAFADHLILAHQGWQHAAIDLQVGDLAVVPEGIVADGGNFQLAGRCSRGPIIRAVAPGVGRIATPQDDWSAYVRVSRKNFRGWAKFRHFSEPGEELKP